METWKTLDKTVILNHSKYLTVEDHTVQLPEGRIIPNWSYIITPDYINVLAITQNGEALCFRQTKYALGESLAIVGGYLEPGEEPLAAAKRELLEETGYVAAEWQSLGHYTLDANRGCGQGHLFLAQGAVFTQARNADDLEEQQLLLLSLAELEAALYKNEFKALSWTATIALAFNRLKSRAVL
jgi:ADP-ribose pyrophosphatase